jgi:2-oxoglutarate ferredoxin oxidoreductase subunit gamma
MINFNFSGFGGQGVLTAGMILIHAGTAADNSVTWYPSYGSEMRGGTANCQVTICDDEVASPASRLFDVVVAMNEPSLDKFEYSVKTGGVLMINSSLIDHNRTYRDDIEVVAIPATDIANEMNNPRGTNIVMLGAIIRKTDIFEKEFFLSQIHNYFGKKGKNNPKNDLCFERGFEAV